MYEVWKKKKKQLVVYQQETSIITFFPNSSIQAKISPFDGKSSGVTTNANTK